MEVVFVPSSCSSSLCLLWHCLRCKIESHGRLEPPAKWGVSCVRDATSSNPKYCNREAAWYLLPDVMHRLVPFLHVSTNEMDSVLFRCFQWQNDHSIRKKWRNTRCFFASSTATSISSWMQQVPQAFQACAKKIHGKKHTNISIK